MLTYRFTAFERSGEVIKDEDWTFASDVDAKVSGATKIEELGLTTATFRLVDKTGNLILFHV